MLMMDSSNPSAFTDEPEEMPMPVTLPEPRAVDHPAQEPAPAVDEAVYFNLVPAAPMHMIVAEASPGSASETVIGVEKHAAAVSLYPYGLQPAQDAPAEPVAEANVLRARRYRSRGSKGISSIPMPARSPHGSSAALRAALMLYCGFTARLRLVALGRVALFLHQGLVRRVRLGVPRNAKALVCAGSEGGESGVRVQRHCTDTGRSPRRAGCARGGQRVRSFQCRYRGGYEYAAQPPRIRASRRCGFDIGESADALVPRWTGRIVGMCLYCTRVNSSVKENALACYSRTRLGAGAVFERRRPRSSKANSIDFWSNSLKNST
ncbi:hypothetical protein FB451DRAFT_1575266 [Mycena latifolia]|nr:hypothetical protein FB451DRAFT_1575266 [Mycena latifolia]